MTARITSPQQDRIKEFAGNASRRLTKDGAQRIIAQGGAFQRELEEMLLRFAAAFYISFSDDEAVAWLVKLSGKSKSEARQIVAGLRSETRKLGVKDSVNIHAETQPGCLFKRDTPQMGPCWEDFKYLRDWDFPDPPTEHALVSWIPGLLSESTSKTVDEQRELVARVKVAVNLPPWYELSFGSVGHLAGMALLHHKATEGQDPWKGLIARTDTCLADGSRLHLRWDGGQLYCVLWNLDEGRRDFVGVSALGVVKALGR